MSATEKQLLDLIELTYGAALDPGRWPHLIESIARAVDGQGGALNRTSYARQETAFFGTAGYDGQLLPAYRDYFITIDPYRNYFETVPIGVWQLSSQLYPRGSIAKTEFHNNFMRPQDKEYSAGATLARDSDSTVKLAIHRSHRVGDFEEKHLRILRLLSPHISQAVQVHSRLAATSARASLALASLDRARIGIFLIDARGKVVYVNCEGEKLCVSGVLGLRQGILSCATQTATAQLCKLIASAARLALGDDIEAGGTLNLLSPAGNASVELRVIPLLLQSKTEDFGPKSGCVAVFASRPGALQLPWQQIAKVHRLSPAESRLAAALAEGCSLEQAAERLSVSMNTVRTQLKSIFAKTSTHRQSELVAMLLSGVLAWCNADAEK